MSETDWSGAANIYKEGGSDVEVAKHLGLTEAAFYSLMEDNEAFRTFVDRGRTLAKAWWYEQGRRGIWSKELNSSLFNFSMKNRYGWADKIDTNDTTDKDPVSREQVEGQLHSALKQISKKYPELLSGVNLNQPKER